MFEQAGTVLTDVALGSEQMAMQAINRFQFGSAVDLPSHNLYTMLPREWPLARMSVSFRHISVFLRAIRRLSFEVAGKEIVCPRVASSTGMNRSHSGSQNSVGLP